VVVLASDPNERSLERALALAPGIEITDIQTLMQEADVVVAATGVSGLIRPEMVREGQVIFALTYPHSEIEPEDALAAGAAFAADGRV
jgi:malate dehydrogenase (oxaloacetate-decarboxylating)